MKKKILSVALIMVMLLSTMFVLAGCGDEEETPSKKKDKKEKENMSISSTTNTEIEEEEHKNKESKQGIPIEKICTPYRDGLAVVEDSSKNKYVIDEGGNIILNKDGIIRNGYISCENSIYDKNGKLVVENKSKTYGEVSKSGYVPVTVITEDVSGTKKSFQFEDLKGNIISDTFDNLNLKISYHIPFESNHYSWARYLFEDCYLVRKGEDNYYFYDVKNNKLINVDDLVETYYFDKGSLGEQVIKCGDGYILVMDNGDYSVYVNRDLSQGSEFTPNIFNKYCLIADSRREVYEVRDSDNNVLKDFSEIGKIESYAEYDGVLYVITETGYIYTMNDKFEYISEPVKTKYTSVVCSDNGVWAHECVEHSKGKFYLLNEKLEIKKECSSEYYYNDAICDGRFVYERLNDPIERVYDLKNEKDITMMYTK